MGFHYDPEAEKRSLMIQQKVLCNGEKNGRSCAFYWAHSEKVESANPDNLRRGETFRVCVFPGGGPNTLCHELNAGRIATECNQYKPRRLPILQRPLGWLGLIKDPGKYDSSYEEYNPLTPEEIKAIQEAMPTPEEDRTAVVGGTVEAAVASFKKDYSIDEAVDALDDNSEDEGIFSKQSKGENS